MSKVNKATEGYKRKLEYIQRWNKTQKKISITFNPKTDKDILEKLENVEAKATYIKELIRKDMKENK